MTVPTFLKSRYGGWLAALAFVVVWYALLQGISHWAFQVSVRWETVPRDLAANLLLGAVLYAAARNLTWYLPAVATLLAALHLGNAAKIAVLGGPVMPDDFTAMGNLFLLLEGWQLAAAAAIIAVPLLLLFAMIQWRTPRTWSLFGAVGTAALCLVVAPLPVAHAMDDLFGNIVWNQRGNFEHRGLLVHMLQETSRHLARGANPPSESQVVEALDRLQQPGAMPVSLSSGPSARRNVHMIVLESFWDPALLTAAGLSADPLDPRFRRLWAEAGNSRALSPVFGGYTANAEFEALCGFPVTEDAVFFEGWLRRDVPCLPAHLGSGGYRTLASHPNIAVFWNRVNAYQRIGFDTYWSKRDFVLDDMNHVFLSDISLYRQVLEKIQPMLENATPTFNYILTFFGHLHYQLNEQRPAVIKTSQGSSLAEAYANTLYYKSRELMTFLEVLRARDPEAVIVLFGDHLPFLGPNFAAFTDSGLLANNRSEFSDAMFETVAATPLVVIDGKRGPLRLGDVPMYQLPQIILGLLGDHRPSILRLAANPEGSAIRPLPGMLLTENDDQWLVCRGKTPRDDACQASTNWLQAVQTLSRDLFGGRQYVLKGRLAPPAREIPSSRPETGTLVVATGLEG